MPAGLRRDRGLDTVHAALFVRRARALCYRQAVNVLFLRPGRMMLSGGAKKVTEETVRAPA